MLALAPKDSINPSLLYFSPLYVLLLLHIVLLGALFFVFVYISITLPKLLSSLLTVTSFFQLYTLYLT